MEMSRIDLLKKLRAKSEVMTFDIDGEPLELTTRGLTFAELSELTEIHEKKDGNKRASEKFLMIVLKENFPENSDDELTEIANSMDARSASKLIAKVSELSGFATDETKKLTEESN